MSFRSKWQGVIELCLFIFDNISAHWGDYTVQYGIDFWRAGFHGLWMASCGMFHHGCWTVHGWNMLFISYFWGTLLLECEARWSRLGTLCLMDHWMVNLVILFWWSKSTGNWKRRPIIEKLYILHLVPWILIIFSCVWNLYVVWLNLECKMGFYFLGTLQHL